MCLYPQKSYGKGFFFKIDFYLWSTMTIRPLCSPASNGNWTCAETNWMRNKKRILGMIAILLKYSINLKIRNVLLYHRYHHLILFGILVLLRTFWGNRRQGERLNRFQIQSLLFFTKEITVLHNFKTSSQILLVFSISIFIKYCNLDFFVKL